MPLTTFPVTERDIRAALGEHADIDIRLFDTLDSTNTEAKRHAAEETRPALYIARTQTEGRGRSGRSFHSPETGLYMTLAYTTRRPLTDVVPVTALAATAASTAMQAVTGKEPHIKWVNDLYLGGGKVAGILVEAVTLSTDKESPLTRLLVGIGVNLTTTSFPADLRAPAASLYTPAEAAALPLPEAKTLGGRLAGEITRRLLSLFSQPFDAAVLPDGEDCLSYYRRRLLFLGETVTLCRGDTVFEGRVVGVDKDHSLLCEVEGSIEVLVSGEIVMAPTKA